VSTLDVTVGDHRVLCHEAAQREHTIAASNLVLLVPAAPFSCRSPVLVREAERDRLAVALLDPDTRRLLRNAALEDGRDHELVALLEGRAP
jgi:hypothetical protein